MKLNESVKINLNKERLMFLGMSVMVTFLPSTIFHETNDHKMLKNVFVLTLTQ